MENNYDSFPLSIAMNSFHTMRGNQRRYIYSLYGYGHERTKGIVPWWNRRETGRGKPENASKLLIAEESTGTESTEIFRVKWKGSFSIRSKTCNLISRSKNLTWWWHNILGKWKANFPHFRSDRLAKTGKVENLGGRPFVPCVSFLFNQCVKLSRFVSWPLRVQLNQWLQVWNAGQTWWIEHRS